MFHLHLLLPLLLAIPVISELQHIEFPHLIIPLVETDPDFAYGTQLTGNISASVHTEISFDVPDNITANVCRINFHINTNSEKNAPYTLIGLPPYSFIVSRLEPKIDEDTDTWNSHPDIMEYVAGVTLWKSGRVDVSGGWFECPKGQVAQFKLWASKNAKYYYDWFELKYEDPEGGPHGITLEMYT